MEIILYLLSEFSILGGIICLMIGCLGNDKTVKSRFNTTKIALIIGTVFAVIFYNKSAFPEILSATPFTTIFFVFCSVLAYVWISLSYRWFTSQNISSFYFCVLSLIAVLCCKMMIYAINVAVLFMAMSILAVVNYLFLRLSQEAEEFHQLSARYGWSIVFFIGLMLVSLVILMPENWSYQSMGEFIALHDDWLSWLVIAGILFFVFFLLGIAPFHFGVTDIIAPAILPVAVYFILVPYFALWAVIIKIFAVYGDNIAEARFEFLTSLGLLSVFVGAIGAHTSRNIKKILSYISLFNSGNILIVLSSFQDVSLLDALLYMQACILGVFGFFACFYSFKRSREYLNNLSMLNGIASVRPYISAAMLFFSASLICVAPLTGFIGQFAIYAQLSAEKRYIVMAMIMGGFIIASAAVIRIVYALYFAPRQTEYDRPDQGIYLYLAIIVALIVTLMILPQYMTNTSNIILRFLGQADV